MTLIPSPPESLVLERFIEILGLEPALYLSRTCGSRPLYIPESYSGSVRLRHLSPDLLERLRAEYGGIQLRRFPQAQRWFVRQMHWRVIDALDRGESPKAVAQRFELSEEWICQIARGLLAGSSDRPKDLSKSSSGGSGMNEKFFSNAGLALRVLWGLAIVADKVSKVLADGKVTDQELVTLVGEGVLPLLREVGVRGLPESQSAIAREVSVSLKA